MKSLFHIADWLPTIVQGVAGGQVSFLKIAIFNIFPSKKVFRHHPLWCDFVVGLIRVVILRGERATTLTE